MTSIIDRFRLDGKVAVITGASSGLGRGFAHALSQAGATVVLGARREESLAGLAEQIYANGAPVSARRTDVTNPEDYWDMNTLASFAPPHHFESLAKGDSSWVVDVASPRY